LNESNVSLTAESLHHLRATKPWVRLVSIMLWIGAAFTVLGVLMLLVGGAGMSDEMPAGFTGAFGVMYGLVALIYIFLALFLGRYASGIGKLMAEPKAPNLEYALKAQRSFWTLSGIIMLISIVIGVLGIVAAIVIPMMTAGGAA